MLTFYDKHFRARVSLHAKVFIFAVVVCVLMIGIDSFRAWNAREQQLAETQRDTLNLSRSLAQQARDTIQTADTMLVGLKERVETDGAGLPQTQRLHRFLQSLTINLPLLHSIFVLSEQGEPLASSLENLKAGLNYDDRDYFKYHAVHADDAVHVSGPLKSKSDGSWIIVVSRRLDHRDGSFDGLVMATISIDFFQHFYDTVDVGSKGAIMLSGDDGSVVVRKPFDVSNIGRHIVLPPATVKILLSSSSVNFDNFSPIDAQRRIGTVYPLGKYPLFVLVAQAKSEALADWRQEAQTHLIGVFVLAAIMVLLGTRLAGEIRSAQKAQRLYRLLADNSTDAIVCARLDGRRTYVSPSFETLTGWPPDELVDHFWGSLVHSDDHAAVKEKFDALLSGARQASVSYRQMCKDGSYLWMEAVVRLVPQGPDGSQSFIANVRDIAERKGVEDQLAAVNKELIELTVTDALTGIANRRKFDAVVEAEWARARREDVPLSLLLIDIDFFKKYNDHYGHQKGDECLCRIAETIEGAVYRAGDLAARIGGEEFAVILPRTNADAARLTGQRIRLAIESLRLTHAESPIGRASVSIGVATADHTQAIKPAGLMQLADRALYRAKENGRDRVEVASDKSGLGHVA